MCLGDTQGERFLLAVFVGSQGLQLEPRSAKHDAQHSKTSPAAAEPTKCLSDG